MSTPIWAADCLTICAKCGISWVVSVSSDALKPRGTPALPSSCLASARFFVRWGTLVSVDGNDGEKGLSLPTCACPLNRAATMAGRSRV